MIQPDQVFAGNFREEISDRSSDIAHDCDLNIQARGIYPEDLFPAVDHLSRWAFGSLIENGAELIVKFEGVNGYIGIQVAGS